MIDPRAARALLILAIAVSPLLAGPVPPARAQTGTVQLSLLRQTPWWTSPRSPFLTVSVLAKNNGQARIGGLSITLAFGNAFTSRRDYETSLTEGPSSGADTS